MVDSDFDIDEDDEPASDQEFEEKGKRKTSTRAYQVLNIEYCLSDCLGSLIVL